VEQLGDDQVGDGVVERGAEEHDPRLQQARVDVERALAAGGLLDDGGDEDLAHGDSRQAEADVQLCGCTIERG
jgi:hypothetical protein